MTTAKRVPKAQLSPRINSNVALRYLWLNWRIIGMHPTRRFRKLYFVFSAMNIIFASLAMPFLMVLNLFFLDGAHKIFNNLYLSVTIVLCSTKYFSLFLHRGRLLRVKEFLGPLDERCSHPEDHKLIQNAIRFCHIYCVLLIVFYQVLVSFFTYIAFSSRRLVYDSWIPPIYGDPDKDLTWFLIYQNVVVQCIMSPQNANNDMYSQCYLAVIVAHLRALGTRIERIGKDNSCSAKDNLQELYNYIEDHKYVLRYLECIRPVISRTTLMQFTGTALVLGLSMLNYMSYEQSTAETVVMVMYLTAVAAESLPTCWFVNTLMYESNKLKWAMYSCPWYEQNQKFRKTLIIFMQCSQKENVIVAGNLVPATLTSFLTIIKFSFSLYTILKD